MIENEKVNAEYAVEVIVNRLLAIFDKMDDLHLSRTSDVISDIGRELVLGLQEIDGKGTHRKEAIRRASKLGEVVLVVDELLPGHFSIVWRAKAKVKAIVTREGGPTAHAILIAKAVGIPVVTGVENLNEIHNDDNLAIDGYGGYVLVNPDENALRDFRAAAKIYEGKHEQIIARTSGVPFSSMERQPFTLLGNVARFQDTPLVDENGGKGVGLFRTEYLYWDREPTVNEIVRTLMKINSAFPQGANPEIIVRAPDFGGDKHPPERYGIPENLSGPLGVVGPRIYFQNETTIQMIENFHRAVLLASAKIPNLKLMYPMITVPEEIGLLKSYLNVQKEQLREDGKEFNDSLKVGIMVETPSAFLIADDLAEMVDFFSLGTNDAQGYTMILDRNNWLIKDRYDPFRKSLLWSYRRAANAAINAEIDIEVCGDAASDPLIAILFAGLGIRKLSMVANDIPRIQYLFNNTSFVEAQAVAQKVLEGHALMGTMEQRKGALMKIINSVMSQKTINTLSDLESPWKPI